MDLAGFGGEVWLQTPLPVWVFGGILALHAGWFVGVWVVGRVVRRVVR